MALKADNSQGSNQVVVNGVSSPAGDIQVVELATVAGGVVQEVGVSNPLPVAQYVAGSPVSNANPLPIEPGPTLISAAINVAASGDSPIVAAQGVGVRIYVVSLVVVTNVANTVSWKSGATLLTGPMAFAANGGYTQAGSVLGPVLVTAANAALNLNLGSAAQVSGNIVYYTGP